MSSSQTILPLAPMNTLYFFVIIGVFLVLLFLNVFFRLRVLKVYKYLVRHEVQFGFSHFLNAQKMHEEVIIKYPDHKEEILSFVKLIRQSVFLASLLLAIILFFGYLLLKLR